MRDICYYEVFTDCLKPGHLKIKEWLWIGKNMEITELSHFLLYIHENQNETLSKMKYQKIYGGKYIYTIKNGIIIKVSF